MLFLQSHPKADLKQFFDLNSVVKRFQHVLSDFWRTFIFDIFRNALTDDSKEDDGENKVSKENIFDNLCHRL